MAAPDRGILEWLDVAGGFLRAASWVAVAGPTGPLEVALQNASHAELLYVTIAAPTIGASAPVGGQYHLTQDVALLNFATIPGTSIQVTIPAPVAAVFGANSTVVDPTNPLVAAVIAAAIGVLTDAAGNPVTAYVGGSKASRRTEQL
jgi:hypothetical protein